MSRKKPSAGREHDESGSLRDAETALPRLGSPLVERAVRQAHMHKPIRRVHTYRIQAGDSPVIARRKNVKASDSDDDMILLKQPQHVSPMPNEPTGQQHGGNTTRARAAASPSNSLSISLQASSERLPVANRSRVHPDARPTRRQPSLSAADAQAPKKRASRQDTSRPYPTPSSPEGPRSTTGRKKGKERVSPHEAEPTGVPFRSRKQWSPVSPTKDGGSSSRHASPQLLVKNEDTDIYFAQAENSGPSMQTMVANVDAGLVPSDELDAFIRSLTPTYLSAERISPIKTALQRLGVEQPEDLEIIARASETVKDSFFAKAHQEGITFLWETLIRDGLDNLLPT